MEAQEKALVYTDKLTTEAELADISAGAVRALGSGVTVGAWTRDPDVPARWRAPVNAVQSHAQARRCS